MVGPVPEEDRSRSVRRLQAGFVALVGISAGLIAFQGDLGPAGILGATLGGTLLGFLLIWLAVPSSLETSRDRRR